MTPVGLTSPQAAARLASEGPNTMPPPRRRSAWRRYLDELTHFFALMLWAAAVLGWIAHMPQLSIAIVAVIVINATFSFIQQRRADRAAERLRSLLPSDVTVRRDGRPLTIPAADVVVDDLLLLSAGDRVPADADIVRASALRIDASLLSGESEPVDVERGGVVLAGTFVVEGDAEAVVLRTGSDTRLAGIAHLTAISAKPVTPLTLELRRVVRLVTVMALGVGALFFAITALLGNPWSDAFVFAIGVTVALVPEALLPTVTLTLAWGAEQMARRQVLVRDLEAVETLGSTTFVCTDKTGTLTRNEMTVVAAWTPTASVLSADGGYDPAGRIDTEGSVESLHALALAAVQSSDGYVTKADGSWRPHGDPMEAAFDVFGRRLGLDTDAERLTVHHRFPFDPRRRRMSVVADDQVICKGAPDAVLPLCGVDAVEAVDAWAEQGLRVLAIAQRSCGGVLPDSPDEAERDLTLVGLIALQDPPRADVGASLQACRDAGITVAMVTGDHPTTAAAIATQVGLRGPDDPVFVGSELPADDAVLAALIDRPGVVIARVSPEDKLRIATALRSRGHVVAMTGDGVNDVPALHASDIGIAMGRSGTDVAREAADLVLLDDDFASIVAGIEQGRATYVNMRRFLTYHLTDNVAELTPFVVWALSGGSFPLALGVLQVLAIDIGTDTLSAVALGAEPPSRHLLQGPPVSGRLMNRRVLIRAFAILGPTIAAVSMIAFLATFWAAGWRPGSPFPTGSLLLAASGAAFVTVVTGQKANAFACRSTTRWPGAIGWFANRLLIPAQLAELAFAAIVVFVPAIALILGQAPPTAAGWIIAIMAPVLMLSVDALDKAVRRRTRGVSHQP